MKKSSSLIFRCKKGDPAVFTTEMLVMGVFSDALKSSKLSCCVNRELDQYLSQVMSLNDFSANIAETHVLYPKASFSAKRILWVGLGEKRDFSLRKLRQVAEAIGRESINLQVCKLCLAIHTELPTRLLLQDISRICPERILFGVYRFDEYVTSTTTLKPHRLVVHFVDPVLSLRRKLLQGLISGQAIGEANALARTLSNRPANALYPQVLALEAKILANQTKVLTTKVYDYKKMRTMGMGGILAVGNRSRRRPCLIELEYIPKTIPSNKKPSVALIGKAVTFDSGGISINPSANLAELAAANTLI